MIFGVSKRIYLILCFFFLCARLSATELTTMVTAYNAAKATPILTEQQWVAFTNTNHSKGNIGVGDTATLQIGGVPSGSVSQLTAYISSNKSSGSADVTCCIAHNEQTIASGPFNKWKPSRCWSTDALPFSVKGTWSISPEDTITLTIVGTANSVHLDKMVLTYTQAIPVPHSVSLVWQTPDATWHNQVLQENIPSEGVILPNITNESYIESHFTGNETWIFNGWCAETVLESLDKPLTYDPNKRFYPKEDITLYGLYYGSDEIIDIKQDTSFESGEYALVAAYGNEWRMLSGGVKNGVIRTRAVTISSLDNSQDQTFFLLEPFIPMQDRFRLSFLNDSVTIVHTLSNTGVGFKTKKLTSLITNWALEHKNNHSLCFFSNDTTKSGANYLLWIDRNDLTNDIVAYMGPFLRHTMTTGWLIFDISNIPSTQPTLYFSTQPFQYASLLQLKRYPSFEKYLHKGRVYIQSPTHSFFINGQQLF